MGYKIYGKKTLPIKGVLFDMDGVVMTDWYATNPGQASSALCMAAGNDMIMPGMFLNKQQILLGLRSGKLTYKDLRRCCGNVLRQILDSDIQRQFIGTSPVILSKYPATTGKKTTK